MIINSRERLEKLAVGELLSGFKLINNNFYIVSGYSHLKKLKDIKWDYIDISEYVIDNGPVAGFMVTTRFIQGDIAGLYLCSTIEQKVNTMGYYCDFLNLKVYNPVVGIVNFYLDDKTCKIENRL